MPTIIETGYRCRAAFVPLHRRLERWSAIVAHRRSGKTVACVNDLVDAALRSTKTAPRFAYIAPYFAQAKDNAWSYLKHYTAAIPGAVPHETELRVDLPGDRRIRLYGADNYHRLRGIYLDGVVLDEYGDMDPRAFPEVIRATLADREGWAIFAGTSRGRNHFADLWDAAQGREGWFTLRLPASTSGLLPKAEIDDARANMSDEQFAAEFECSFSGSVVGAYYGKQMQAIEDEGRVTELRHRPEIAVDTWWDLGISDAMSIWFTQTVGREVHVIDYLENSGEGLPWYARALQERGYVYGTHNAPHDIQVRELGSGKSRLETAASLGIRFAVVPNVGVQDGIDAARAFLGRCWFDRVRTERGRLALTQYRKKWDEKRKVFATHPEHGWESHGADAFRYLAVGHKIAAPQRRDATRARVYTAGSGGESWMGN